MRDELTIPVWAIKDAIEWLKRINRGEQLTPIGLINLFQSYVDIAAEADPIQPQRASEPHWQKCPSCGFVGQDTVFFTRPEFSPTEKIEDGQ